MRGARGGGKPGKAGEEMGGEKKNGWKKRGISEGLARRGEASRKETKGGERKVRKCGGRQERRRSAFMKLILVNFFPVATQGTVAKKAQKGYKKN